MLTNLRIVSTIEDVLEGGWNLEDLNTAWNEFLKRLIGFLPQLLVAAVILLVGLLATKVVPKPIKSVLNRTRLDAVAVKYILRVVKISIWALVLMMVLDTVGVPVTSLLTLLAAIGAAVALAIKDNLANLASGVVLLFTKPFKAGDFIEVEGDSGVIREIEMMHTYLDTPGNMRVAIPNTKMMTATITNYSTYETRRQDLTFTISYEDNLLEAMAALQQSAGHASPGAAGAGGADSAGQGTGGFRHCTAGAVLVRQRRLLELAVRFAAAGQADLRRQGDLYPVPTDGRSCKITAENQNAAQRINERPVSRLQTRNAGHDSCARVF